MPFENVTIPPLPGECTHSHFLMCIYVFDSKALELVTSSLYISTGTSSHEEIIEKLRVANSHSLSMDITDSHIYSEFMKDNISTIYTWDIYLSRCKEMIRSVISIVIIKKSRRAKLTPSTLVSMCVSRYSRKAIDYSGSIDDYSGDGVIEVLPNEGHVREGEDNQRSLVVETIISGTLLYICSEFPFYFLLGTVPSNGSTS